MVEGVRFTDGKKNASLSETLLPREIFFTLAAIKGRRLLFDSKASATRWTWTVHP